MSEHFVRFERRNGIVLGLLKFLFLLCDLNSSQINFCISINFASSCLSGYASAQL